MPRPDIAPFVQHCEDMYRSPSIVSQDRTSFMMLFEPFRPEASRMLTRCKNNVYSSYAQAYKQYKAENYAVARLWCEHIKSLTSFQGSGVGFKLAVHFLSIIANLKFLDTIEKEPFVRELSSEPEISNATNNFKAFSAIIRIGLLYELIRKEIIQIQRPSQRVQLVLTASNQAILQGMEREIKETEKTWAVHAKKVHEKIMATQISSLNDDTSVFNHWLLPPMFLYKALWTSGIITRATFSQLNYALEHGEQKKAAKMASDWYLNWNQNDGVLEHRGVASIIGQIAGFFGGSAVVRADGGKEFHFRPFIRS